MNSEAKKRVLAILELINERRLQQEIAGPIDEAIKGFQWPEGQPRTHQVFGDSVIKLVQCIYQNGTASKRMLTAADAFSEAVKLLDRG